MDTYPIDPTRISQLGFDFKQQVINGDLYMYLDEKTQRSETQAFWVYFWNWVFTYDKNYQNSTISTELNPLQRVNINMTKRTIDIPRKMNMSYPTNLFYFDLNIPIIFAIFVIILACFGFVFF